MKKMVLLSLFILSLLLTGCWNARELNELGLTLVIGLDLVDDKVLVTAEVVNPIYSQQSSTTTGQGSYVKYVQGVGNNIYEASVDITLKFDRRLSIVHNRVFILGEDFAKKGLDSQIDELYRDVEQRETAYLLVAKGGKAYEVMGINSGLEELPSNYITKIVENFKYNPKTVDTNLVQYIKQYYKMGHHSIIGTIEKKEKKVIDQTVEKTGTQDYELSVIGSAIFNEDVLVGYLNGNDTKSVNFVMNKIRGGIITFPTPTAQVEGSSTPPPPVEGEMPNKQKDQNLSSVIVIKNNTKNDVEMVDGNIKLKTKIELRGSLGEVVGNIDVAEKENIIKLEEACSKAIEDGIKRAFKKAQKEYGIDIFGYGLVFHRKYPEEWKRIKKDWDEIFSQADFEIEVNTDIIRTGLINTPINKIKGK